MCEANEVGRLNELGFVGLAREMEAVLRFKASNSDPLRTPNYYKVLYSWHISRGDYRSGELASRPG
jgi:nuclear pore complex protein Nup160